MKINTLKTAVLLSSLLTAPASWAQSSGLYCANKDSIQAALSSVATSEVVHDELVLGFTSTSKASSSAQASQRANSALSGKLSYFKGLPGVKDVKTSLNTYQDYQSKGWVGQAQVTVVLDFQKSASLEIQAEPFGVSSTSTRSSESLVLKAKAPLIQEAVSELKQKGALLAKSSGKTSFTLKSIDLQDGAERSGVGYPMVARTMSSDVPELSTANMTQGKSQVQVQVSSIGCLD